MCYIYQDITLNSCPEFTHVLKTWYMNFRVLDRKPSLLRSVFFLLWWNNFLFGALFYR